MAIEICTYCDTPVDLDYQDGYNLIDGQFACDYCFQDWLDDCEAGEVSEAQEWYDYDPDC